MLWYKCAWLQAAHASHHTTTIYGTMLHLLAHILQNDFYQHSNTFQVLLMCCAYTGKQHKKLMRSMVHLHGAAACSKVRSSFLKTVQYGEARAAELIEHDQALDSIRCPDRRRHNSTQVH